MEKWSVTRALIPFKRVRGKKEWAKVFYVGIEVAEEILNVISKV